MTNNPNYKLQDRYTTEIILPIVKKHITRIISSKENNPNVVTALTLGYIKDIDDDITKEILKTIKSI